MKREIDEKLDAGNEGGRTREAFKRTENQAFCVKCGRQVGLLSFERAGDILKTGLDEILELAEAGQIHRLHNALGNVAVCAESLFEVLETRPTERFNSDIFKTNPSNSKIFFEINRND